MAPPRTILYPTRVNLFLDYRRKGRKVNPIANQYGVARSSVSLVVKEFLEAGFSDRPRLDLPQNLLEEAQRSHQCEVIEALKKAPIISIAQPDGHVHGGLSESDALGEKAIEILQARLTTGLDVKLLWHLKGTKAEKTLKEVGKAITRYSEQCFGFWQMIRADIEKGTGHNVAQAGAELVDDATGLLYPFLIDAVYRRFCSLPNHNESLESGWPRLTSLEGTNGEMGIANSSMAWARSASDELSDYVFETVKANTEVYLSYGKKLVATHGDLRYVLSYAQILLGEVEAKQVQHGICPECPYPESVDRPALDHQPGDENVGGEPRDNE